jgi:hypothetical protein
MLEGMLLRLARPAALLGLVLGVVFADVQAAHATVVVRMNIPELTRGAEVIALGRVERKSTRWSGRRIVTDVELSVERSLKGKVDAGGRLRFQRLGGVVNGIGQRVFGEPTFGDGETVLVFLRRIPLATEQPLGVVGLAQGKMTVVSDPSGIRWVTRNLAGLSVLSPPARTATSPAETPPAPSAAPRELVELAAPQRLEEVIEVVQRTLAGVP